MNVWIFFVVGSVILFTCFQYLMCLEKAAKMKAKQLYSPLLWLAILFFVLGIMYIAWFFEFFDQNIKDLLTISILFYTAVAYFYAVLFLKLRESIYLNVLKWVYLAIIPFSLFNLDLTLGSLAFVSSSFLFLSSMTLLRNLKDHLFMISASTMFCAAFLLASLAIYAFGDILPLAYFTAPIFLCVSSIVLNKHLNSCGFKADEEKHDLAFPIVAMRTLFFTMIILVFSLSLTLIFHEIGHAATATFLGCTNPNIIFSLHDYPFTQTSCPQSAKIPVLYSGVAATTLISLILFIARPKFSSYMGIAKMGLGFFFASGDLTQLVVQKYVYALFMLGAFFFSFYGLCRLTLYSYNRNIRHKHNKPISVECLE